MQVAELIQLIYSESVKETNRCHAADRRTIITTIIIAAALTGMGLLTRASPPESRAALRQRGNCSAAYTQLMAQIAATEKARRSSTSPAAPLRIPSTFTMGLLFSIRA